MTCRSCGTEIADKALVCYRCGTATSEPRVPAPAGRPDRGVWPVVAAILAIVIAAVLVLPQTPEGPARMGAWAAVVLATIGAVRVLRPLRPRSRWRR
jgi:hypothetical protein